MMTLNRILMMNVSDFEDVPDDFDTQSLLSAEESDNEERDIEERDNEERDNSFDNDARNDSGTYEEDEPGGTNERPNDHELRGKNGTIWLRTPPPAIHKRRQQDIIHGTVGPTWESKTESIKETFKLLLTNEIMDIIICETNQEAECSFRLWNDAHPDSKRKWKALTQIEFEAFIGLLLSAGVNQVGLESLQEMWSVRNGKPIFRATMSYDRFCAILRYLRFNNKETREARRATDKLAAFRDVWDMFVINLRRYYIPRQDMTVDKQLVTVCGRCPFRQYMATKPAKYGIKIWWNCCASTSYSLNGQVYLGKVGNHAEKNQGERVVKDMVRPWLGKGRNVVCDNFFTSVPLCDFLLANNTAMVGTMRKNKADIPK